MSLFKAQAALWTAIPGPAYPWPGRDGRPQVVEYEGLSKALKHRLSSTPFRPFVILQGRRWGVPCLQRRFLSRGRPSTSDEVHD
jgi:hypothetical protein